MTVTKKINVPKKEASQAKKNDKSKTEPKKKVKKSKPKIAPKPLKRQGEVLSKKLVASVPTASQRIAKTDAAGLYNPEGKLDPFAPLFKAKRITQAIKKKKKVRLTPRTPLEKIDLSQLKLVAVILSQRGNKALVQEATGKGYIVKKGVYIGLSPGKIVQILKDRIIIEEEAEDIYGKKSISKKELKLQKPPGE
jgi:type IV pilus assembly protein PilP